MTKIQRKKSQNAQGMVEFALVLPILLLVILGVFAFGHLFYVYSSVVSASREAARWGAATGVSAGADSLPRYQNCEEIRATAARVAPIAGITQANSPNANTPGVQITYDKGPDDTTSPKPSCTTSPGPSVSLGDRINVTVRVRYQPIVPLIPIPSFMLQANTARTIIKEMAVGEAPVAVPVGPRVDLTIKPTPSPAKVNEPVTIEVVVNGSDQAPTGTVQLSDDAGNSYPCSPLTIPSTGTGTIRTVSCTVTYITPATLQLKAHYNPTGTHFAPADAPDVQLVVEALTEEETTVVMTPSVPSVEQDKVVNFSAVVAPVSGPGTPSGSVNILDVTTSPGVVLCSTNALQPASDGASSIGSCSTTFNTVGIHKLKAIYNGEDPLYKASEGAIIDFRVTPFVKIATTTTISLEGRPSVIKKPTTFYITINPAETSSYEIGGTVTVTDESGAKICDTVTVTKGKATCTYTFNTEKAYRITATYSGDTRFLSSSTDFTFDVTNPPPTPEPPQPGCPRAESMTALDFNNVTNGLAFKMTNPNNGQGGQNRTILSVELWWPTGANLIKIYFGNKPSAPDVVSCGEACTIASPSDGYPLYYSTDTTKAAGSSFSINSSGYLVQTFDHPLTPGLYTVRVNMSGGCTVVVQAGKQ